MDAITITGLAGAAWAILAPLMMRRESIRKRYQSLEDRELIDANVFARMMRKYMLAVAFLGPIPVAFVLGLIRDPKLGTPLICVMMLIVFGGLSSFWMFWEITRITTAEIEYRKFQSDKESNISQPEPGEVRETSSRPSG